MKRVTRTLLERSQQAYLLSLEIFNKPTIKYRIEGFCFFFVNAWELLCKARIIDQTGRERPIYYPKKRGQPLRTLSMRDALATVIPNESDPVRRNIERIAALRDYAAHFLIPEMEAVYAGLFQAGLLNYVEYLRAWFHRRVTEQGTPPLLSLVWDAKDLDSKIIEKRHGADARRFLEQELLRLKNEEQGVADRRFSISIEYKLVLTKKPQEADITLGAGPGGALVGQVVFVPKDFTRTHPYRQAEVIELVQRRLPAGVHFSSYGFQATAFKEKIKNQDASEHHYLIKQTSTHCYSERLVDYIVEKITSDATYLVRAQESYQRHIASARQAKPRSRE